MSILFCTFGRYSSRELFLKDIAQQIDEAHGLTRREVLDSPEPHDALESSPEPGRVHFPRDLVEECCQPVP